MTESLKKADFCSIENCSDQTEFNGPTVNDGAQMPFGGVKGSGLRWIKVQTEPRHYPF